MGCLKLEEYHDQKPLNEVYSKAKNQSLGRGDNEVGIIVSGLNHAMHSIANEAGLFGQKTQTEQQDPGDPWDLDGDGKINLEESTNWWENGKGQPITLDASKIDLDFVDTTGWKAGNDYRVQTLFSSHQGRVLGNIRLHYLGNNKVTIYTDTYDFNQHGTYFSSPVRNFFNSLGRLFAGSGQKYDINFKGVNTIFNPKTQPIMRTFP